MLSIIVAMNRRRVIGVDGHLPWHLPSDLKHFRHITVGHTVIMGRKTYESLPDHFRPLPDRTNVVLSTSWSPSQEEGVIVLSSWSKVLNYIEDLSATRHFFVIGGQSVFELALPMATTIHLTRVEDDQPGPVLFPEFEGVDWCLVENSEIQQGRGDQFPFRFETYRRRDD